MREFAPAKVNLFLHVLGKRGDGYHELESLVVFADVGDHLTAAPADKMGLSLSGPFADALRGFDPEDNLVLRAAKVTEEWAWGENKDLPPLHFTLEKHLPVSSGIGSGSADAAAAMRLAAGAAGLTIDADLYARAATLGADVPVCLFGKPAWMSGLGEKLAPARVPEGLGIVLVNPGVEVSTAEVFKALGAGPATVQERNRPDLHSVEELAAFLKSTRNDLEAPAFAAAPVIRKVIDAIEETSPHIGRMSGSGATCFGLFASIGEAEAAALRLREAHHDWWVMAARLMRP